MVPQTYACSTTSRAPLLGIDGVIVPSDVLGQSRLFTRLLGIVVLLSALEKTILSRVVMLADLGRIVARASRRIRLIMRRIGSLSGLVELLVAAAVFVPAAMVGHCSPYSVRDEEGSGNRYARATTTTEPAMR